MIARNADRCFAACGAVAFGQDCACCGVCARGPCHDLRHATRSRCFGAAGTCSSLKKIDRRVNFPDGRGRMRALFSCVAGSFVSEPRKFRFACIAKSKNAAFDFVASFQDYGSAAEIYIEQRLICHYSWPAFLDVGLLQAAGQLNRRCAEASAQSCSIALRG